MSEKDQTKPNFSVITNKEREEAEKLAQKKVSPEMIDALKNYLLPDIMNQMLVKMDSHVLNTEIKDLRSEVTSLKDVVSHTANQLLKQTIGDRSSALKVDRNNDNENAISVKSLNRHLDFYVFTGHIAELFEIYTKDGKKFSVSAVTKMMKELNLRDDENFSYMDAGGKETQLRKYSYYIFEEIVDRLTNPAKYNLKIEITSSWITKCTLPNQEKLNLTEIQ